MIILINGEERVYLDDNGNPYADESLKIPLPQLPDWAPPIQTAKPKPARRRAGREAGEAEEEPIVVTQGNVYLNNPPKDIVKQAKRSGLLD